MAKVRIGNVEIEMSSTQEVVSLLRQLGVVEKPQQGTLPLANGHHAAQSVSPEKPWTAKDAMAFHARLKEGVRTALMVVLAHDGPIAGDEFAKLASVHPKGVGSVLNTIGAVAKAMNLPSPIVKDLTKKNGSLRDMLIRVTGSFRVASEEAGIG